MAGSAQNIKKTGPLVVSLLVFLGAVIAAIILAILHSPAAVISFDEGFHGGSALFVYEFTRYLLHLSSARPTYLIGEFQNGITLYPPLWIGVAGFLSLLFGATTEVFRAATSLFYVGIVFGTFWFIRRAFPLDLKRGTVAGVTAAAIVATIPMVMIYSNLMMLEVPQMLGVGACVGAFYLYTLDLIPRKPWPFLAVFLIFLLGPLTKLAALEVIWGVILLFVVLSSILFCRQRFYKHFLKWELLLLAIVSVAGLAAYIWAVNRYLHVNMIQFFLGQSQEQGAQHSILYSAWLHREFYLRDFKHIPGLSILWFGSVALYALWRRSALGLLLVVWTAGVYTAFSAVLPQVPQYIMPLYAPLAMGTGLMFADLAALIPPPKLGWIALGLATITVVLVQINSLPLSESYGWMNNQSGVGLAAAALAAQAKPGDRVMVWHDGVTYAVQAAGLSKGLQISNSVSQQCAAAMDDSFEWALSVNEPPLPSPLDLQVLNSAPWQIVGRYGPHQNTILYHNTAVTWPATIEGESYDFAPAVLDADASGGKAIPLNGLGSQPALWGCYRQIPLGNRTADYRIKTVKVNSGIADNQAALSVQYSGVPGGEGAALVVTAGQLRKSTQYQDFILNFAHHKMDGKGEFKVTIFGDVSILLDKITVR